MRLLTKCRGELYTRSVVSSVQRPTCVATKTSGLCSPILDVVIFSTSLPASHPASPPLSQAASLCLTQEFSLYTASMADTAGIMLADIAGVIVQGCLFRYNGLPGADFTCGA